MLKEAHIDCTEEMFNKIIEEDKEGERLKELPQYLEILNVTSEECKEIT